MIPNYRDIESVVLAARTKDGAVWVMVASYLFDWEMTLRQNVSPFYSIYVEGSREWELIMRGGGNVTWMTLEEFQSRYSNWEEAMPQKPTQIGSVKLLPRGDSNG